jgi:hypothetical protein
MRMAIQKFLGVVISDHGQIDASQVEKISYPDNKGPFWSIFFKDGEIIDTTMPVLVHWRWEEVPISGN